jgi:hypothetical protein
MTNVNGFRGSRALGHPRTQICMVAAIRGATRDSSCGVVWEGELADDLQSKTRGELLYADERQGRFPGDGDGP